MWDETWDFLNWNRRERECAREMDPHAARVIQESSPVSDVIAPTGKIGDTQIVGNVLIPLNNITSISGASTVGGEASTSLSESDECQ
jgi:hypothetical protein